MKSVACSILAAACSALALGAQPADKAVPVHQEPRHRLVFDSSETRILDVRVPPGDTTLYHTHSDPILYVTMSTSQTRSQILGGDWTGSDASQTTDAVVTRDAVPRIVPVRLGRMTSTTSYAKAPLTHRVNNVGEALFRLIGITNSSAGDPSDAPSADFDHMPEITNQWFRGYRWALSAKSSAHRHVNPVVIVLVSGQAVASGTTQTSLDTPGAFAWFEGGAAHTIHAAGAAEVAEVEVRRPR